MTDRPEASAMDVFVDAIHASGCHFATILAHMETVRASGHSAPDSPPPVETLRLLLTDVLTPPLDRYSDGELRAASQLIDEATTTISQELLLVSPGSMLSRMRRGRRRPHH